jgi:anti-anti-sigma regulatory factor
MKTVDFSFEQNRQVLNCRFNGHLSVTECQDIDTVLHAKLTEIGWNEEMEKSLKVEFDMTEVSYVSSAFIRICIATAKKTGELNFSVMNSNPVIKKTFKIAGLDTLLGVM